MKQHLAELLTYAVGKTFGAYYTPVFSALTEHGRLTLRALSQRTGQPSEVVAQAISGLLQQNLVFYFAGSDRSGDALYEPNWENAYNSTLRAGTLAKLIDARHGKRVGEMFAEIMVAGVARVGDLIQRFTDEPDKHDSPQKGSVNGDTVSEGEPQIGLQTRSAEDIEAAIHTLLRSGLVLPLKNRQFWPGYDLHQEAEIAVKLAKFPAGCNTKRDREACAEDVEKTMRDWREEAFHFTRAGPGGTHKRARTPDEDEDFSTKRQKTSNGLNGTTINHGNNLLDTNLELSVNYEKCNVALRTVQFTRWAARHVGNTTSKVYEAALAVLEGKILRCYDPLQQKKPADPKAPPGSLAYIYNYDDLSPSLTAKEVSALLDKAIDLEQSLPNEDANGVNGQSETAVITNGHVLTLPERVARIELHLAVLCADQREFVVRESGSDSWRIPFQSLTQKLIQAEIENTITARLGKLPAACARILNANGVLDVKQMAQLAIVKVDQVQMAITPLLEAGYISAQELPRDNSRTVERSIWAYTFNAIHARQRLLVDTFKSMARLLQRLEHERARRRTVLEKAARTDVASNEMKYLTATERDTLRRCRELEEFIDRYVIRIDELIAVVRDFSPMVPAQNEFDQVRGHKHLNL